MIIGHFEHQIWNKGGVATYIRRVGQIQEQLGHTVHYLSRLPCPDAQQKAPIIIGEDSNLFAQVEALGIDLLHLHTAINVQPPAYVPLIRTVHGHAPYCPGGSKYLERRGTPCNRPYNLLGCLWGHAVDHCGSVRPHRLLTDFQQTWQEMAVLSQIPVIAVSQFIKAQMLQSGYPAGNIHVIPHFAPLQLEPSALLETGVPHFLFLGRLTPQKGLDWLLRAFQKVSLPAHLDIAGEGYQAAELRTLTHKLGLDERVTFHGWVDPAQVHQLIHKARALVFPSLWHEPAGLVAFEAMAHSRPVICSRVGGAVETVREGVNGLLVEANNTCALTEAIMQLAQDWTLAQRLGSEGWRLTQEEYTSERHLNALMDLYTKTIAA